MSQFLLDVTSVYWWISVVVIGILINLLSQYLPPKLGKLLGNVSGYVRKLNRKEAQERDKWIEYLSHKPDEIFFRFIMYNERRNKEQSYLTMFFVGMISNAS